MTNYEKGQFATEVAFKAMREAAEKVGLPLWPSMGLMYLPTQAVTVQFQNACTAVMKDLGADTMPAGD